MTYLVLKIFFLTYPYFLLLANIARDGALDILLAIITVIGWFAVHQFSLRHQHIQITSELKLGLYKDVDKIKRELDDVCIELSIHINPISFPEHEIQISKITQDGENALSHWNSYLKKYSKLNYQFSKSYRKLWNYIDTWIGVMPDLKLARDELFYKQMGNLSKQLREHHLLISKKIFTGCDEKSDIDIIRTSANALACEFDKIAINFVDDFVCLVHNELVNPVFGYIKKPRENVVNNRNNDPVHVITRNGLEIFYARKKT